MVNQVYIVWCKLNKNTDKFDLGVFIDKQEAELIVETYTMKSKIGKVWLETYRLSKIGG